jgi:hypothetical protein
LEKQAAEKEVPKEAANETAEKEAAEKEAVEKEADVDISYPALQAHGIINVALHREYSPGIIFIFSQGRKDLYHV